MQLIMRADFCTDWIWLVHSYLLCYLNSRFSCSDEFCSLFYLDGYTECGCYTWFAEVIFLHASVFVWSSQILLWFFELAKYFICGYNLHYFLFYWHDQSTVQLALNFLSPESLPESVRMAQEIRCLPNGHFAKLKMLEVSCDLPNHYDDLHGFTTYGVLWYEKSPYVEWSHPMKVCGMTHWTCSSLLLS